MSIPGAASPLFIGAAAEEGAFQIDRSVRLNSADSAHLSKSFSSAGNRKKWTWSGWVKRSNLSSANSDVKSIFAAYTDSSNRDVLRFTDDNGTDIITFQVTTSGTSKTEYTSAVFRDVSAWMHVVLAFDSAQSTASDRVKIYVNGVSQTLSGTAVAQDTQSSINSNVAHYLGARSSSGSAELFYDGYLANVQFIDGQALAPTDFGETDDNNNWNPKDTSGLTFGTNGFHLDFSDNSTAAALGTDTSGNSNTWTVNNISVTAGAGNDSLVDSPTNGTQTDTGAGGEVVGNYATFNALALNGNTLSNGNLDYLAGSANKPTLTTIGIPNTGKWYFEFTDVNSTGSFTAGVGTASVGVSSYLGIDANGWGYQTHPTNAGYHNSGVFTTTGRINGAGGNTIVGIAIDRDAQKIWFSVNGTFVNSGVPASGTNAQYSNLPTSGELFPGASTGSSQSIVYNAGQRPFAYTAPSGFKALCTTNLPDPTIADGSTAFDTKLYTGTGSTQSITGLNFSPDFVWIKNRNAAGSHDLYDIVRGADTVINSDATFGDYSGSGRLTSFNSDGFTLGSQPAVNINGGPFVSWNWDGGTSTATNNDGSIASSVRANPSAGFSIVSYTGTGANATIGHGLNSAPEMIITKNRASATNWRVYHGALGNTKTLFLSTTGATDTSAVYWNNTSPTSTVFSVGSDDGINGNGNAMIAFCFAPVAGYSAFGSYTGNGSSDGTFVYTGHRSRFLLIRALIAGEDWVVIDTEREPYNTIDSVLFANDPTAEITNSAYNTDILSNGFKLRGTNPRFNTSGETYVFASFAEHPFQTARAR